jgi:threonine synthase
MTGGVIARYRAHLPVTERTPIVTLNEGNTPLVEAPRLASLIHPEARLFLKLEGANPTGSFKDRGMTLAVSKAVEEGSRAIICASTGNTSASAAAYAARAGLQCFVLLPHGKVALGKLIQALMHGAQVLQVEGNFDVALELVRTISEQYPVTLVNSLNPYRAEGQKTAAFEICDALGDAPDYHAIPSATPAISQRTGRAFASIMRWDAPPDCRRCSAFRQRAQPLWWRTACSKRRRRWQPPFASAIPPAGTRRCRRNSNRVGCSKR